MPLAQPGRQQAKRPDDRQIQPVAHRDEAVSRLRVDEGDGPGVARIDLAHVRLLVDHFRLEIAHPIELVGDLIERRLAYRHARHLAFAQYRVRHGHACRRPPPIGKWIERKRRFRQFAAPACSTVGSGLPNRSTSARATGISWTLSSVSETRTVSPMPSLSNEPMPMALLIRPSSPSPGLRDAEVQRIIPVRAFLFQPVGQQAVGGDHHLRVARLHRENEVVVIRTPARCGQTPARSRPCPAAYRRSGS